MIAKGILVERLNPRWHGGMVYCATKEAEALLEAEDAKPEAIQLNMVDGRLCRHWNTLPGDDSLFGKLEHPDNQDLDTLVVLPSDVWNSIASVFYGMKNRKKIEAPPASAKPKALPAPERAKYAGMNIPDLGSRDFMIRFHGYEEFIEHTTEMFCKRLIVDCGNPDNPLMSPIEKAYHYLKGTGVDVSGIEVQLKFINLALKRLAKKDDKTVLVLNPGACNRKCFAMKAPLA